MHLCIAELHHREAGIMADQTERRKSEKYSNLDPNIAPVVIETLGVFGKQTVSFLKG